jgi:hypothetical protein
MFYRASKMLVLGDLLFNLPPDVGRWTRGFLRVFSGIGEPPGISRLFKIGIKDQGAFQASMQTLSEQDFEQIIVGHGNSILTDARPAFKTALKRAGMEQT